MKCINDKCENGLWSEDGCLFPEGTICSGFIPEYEKSGVVPVDSQSAGWVSVNEQLPKESGKYRILIQRGSASVTTEETETLFFRKEHRSYWGIGGDWDVVTHWKPNDKMSRGSKSLTEEKE
jgi:hypothetical protein